METVRVLQLGTEDFSRLLEISKCADWYYEPDFSSLPERDFEVVILDREINSDEFDYLIRFMKAYCLFITEKVLLKKGGRTQQLFVRKMGKRISSEELRILLKEELPDYFPNSYGEKYSPENISVAQGFKGRVSWKGLESADLEGDYGSGLNQIVFWRNNIPIAKDQSIDFWLEYEKDDTVEISLELSMLQFAIGTDPQFTNVWNFSEKELNDIVYITNRSGKTGYQKRRRGDKMRDDFAYYGDIVREPELDSCLLADHDGTGMTEAEYIHSVKKEAALAAASFCMEREWDMIELAKSVLMLVLSKYTGHTAALAAVAAKGRLFPVFLDSEKTPDFREYYGGYIRQAEDSRMHDEIPFEELRAELRM